MRFTLRHLALMVWSGSMAWTLTGCGPSQSQSASNQSPVKIRGELIDVRKPSPPAESAATNRAIDAQAAVPAPAVAGFESARDAQVAPALTAAADPKSRASESTEPGDAYPPVGFDKLASYNFEVPDGPATNQIAGPDKADEQIPDRVKAFNSKKVSIKGFMLPLKVEAGAVTEFLIMKDQSMCCFGNVPKITEWVSVKAAGKGVRPIMDQPVSVEGTLHVGATRENGYLVGIYQMEGDKLVDPEGQ